MRLDVYLAEYWPEQSRSAWQKLCRAGNVTVNGAVVLSPAFELDEDDAVAVDIPEAVDFRNETVPVLYADGNVIAINKPPGILTHAKGAALNEFTVAEYMRSRTTDKPDGNRPGIVHRLDRDTSGVIICARNPQTQTYLQRQFSEHKAKKTYIAVLDGVPKEPEATLRLPLQRNPKLPARFRVHANGKPAETGYKISWHDTRFTLAQLQPLTGRTHQLRVHMAYLGTPIHGDRFYGKGAAVGARLALHAYKLEITIPGGVRRTFTAPLPPDMLGLLPREAWRGAV